MSGTRCKQIFGIRNFFLGTLLVAGLAMLLAGIIGTLTAIYLAELSPASCASQPRF